MTGPPSTSVLLDYDDIFERVLPAYANGTAADGLDADRHIARSVLPPGTAAYRDFSHLAPDLPAFDPARCVGCMDCIAVCPDTAILAKVLPEEQLRTQLGSVADPKERARQQANWTKTRKYWDVPARKGDPAGLFGIFVDVSKCKGCGECVEACATHRALRMAPKDDSLVDAARRNFAFFKAAPETPASLINERSLGDMMLARRSLLYTGGAGSCTGCGEATAIRMMLAAGGFVYGAENVAIVNATGCSTVYASTYPYNPYLVSWTNSLFENAPADAMGIRARWDQRGWRDKRLWVIGGDGAMLDIGFGSLSRMLMSGMDIKVLVLDTQVYSNTGGQASTAGFYGQESKFASIGSTSTGKSERRKELGSIAMMHPDVFVAQTVTCDTNHFYRAIMDANAFPGPAVVNVYTTCLPEHGVADEMAAHQARLARDSRAFPVFVYDPRKGDTFRERLSLRGNPAMDSDWYQDPRTGRALDFITFARSEQRFAGQFDADGNASEALIRANADRLANWRQLQELAGLR